MSFKKIASIIEKMHKENIEIPQDIKDIYLDYKYMYKTAEKNAEEEVSSQENNVRKYTHSDVIDFIINTREEGGVFDGQYYWDYKTDRFKEGLAEITSFIRSGKRIDFVERIYKMYLNSNEYKVFSRQMDDKNINITEFAKLFYQEVINKKNEDFLSENIFLSQRKKMSELG